MMRAVPADMPHRSPDWAASRSFAGLPVPLGAVLLWDVAARRGWVPPQILPAPDDVWAAFSDLWASGDLQHDIAISLLRVIEGSVGALDCCWHRYRPVAQHGSVCPAAILRAGADPAGAAAADDVVGRHRRTAENRHHRHRRLVLVTLNTLSGIRAVPPGYFEIGRIFRYSRWATAPPPCCSPRCRRSLPAYATASRMPGWRCGGRAARIVRGAWLPAGLGPADVSARRGDCVDGGDRIDRFCARPRAGRGG